MHSTVCYVFVSIIVVFILVFSDISTQNTNCKVCLEIKMHVSKSYIRNGQEITLYHKHNKTKTHFNLFFLRIVAFVIHHNHSFENKQHCNFSLSKKTRVSHRFMRATKQNRGIVGVHKPPETYAFEKR